MTHLIIFKDDDKLNSNIVGLIDSAIDKFLGKYEELNFSANFYNDSTPLSQLEQKWEEELKNGDEFYIVLHQKKQKGEYSNYLKNFKNVIIRSHHDMVYESLIPTILSGECTLDNIKSYFPDKELENCFELIFKNYDSSKGFSKEVKSLHDYQKSKA